MDKSRDELRKLHLAWTRDDLFERYGAPDSIGGGDAGVSLIYSRSKGPTETQSVHFTTVDGLVTHAYFD